MADIKKIKYRGIIYKSVSEQFHGKCTGCDMFESNNYGNEECYADVNHKSNILEDHICKGIIFKEVNLTDILSCL